MAIRKNPNILITGTPGVGKTNHCEILAKSTGLKHFSINQVVKDKACHDGWSEEHQSYMVDEDKVRSERALYLGTTLIDDFAASGRNRG